MPLKRLKHRHTLLNIRLGGVILRHELRHQRQDVVEQGARDDDDAFEGVADDDVALEYRQISK